MPRTPATLLAIDDEPFNLALLANVLKPHYRVLGARSGVLALALLEQEQPDLILLDVVMPDMDGLTFLVRLKQSPCTADIPVILVSALGDEVDEELGLALGAVDYIVKPIKPAVVKARVRTHLDLHEARQRLQQQNAWLERTLAQRLRDNQLGQDVTLCALTELVETRGDESGAHTLRTQRYVEAMASWLQSHPIYGAQLREPALSMLVKATPLHDIGKIGIPDHILLKPGPLTAEEFEVMKTHARRGGEAIHHAIHRALALHGDDPLPAHPLPERALPGGRPLDRHPSPRMLGRLRLSRWPGWTCHSPASAHRVRRRRVRRPHHPQTPPARLAGEQGPDLHPSPSGHTFRSRGDHSVRCGAGSVDSRSGPSGRLTV
jgi:putative two-component system response regulator